jgi:hypothetical protein
VRALEQSRPAASKRGIETRKRGRGKRKRLFCLGNLFSNHFAIVFLIGL